MPLNPKTKSIQILIGLALAVLLGGYFVFFYEICDPHPPTLFVVPARHGQSTPFCQTIFEKLVERKIKRAPDARPHEPPLTPTAIDTSTWKTYRNEEYGFEVQFPPRWFSMKTEIVHDDYYEGDHVIFKLPTKVSPSYRAVCDISIYQENNWKRFQADDTIGKPIYLNFHNGIVYVYGCGQDDAGLVGFDEYNNAVDKKEFNTPLAETPYGEFKLKILSTFKFIK